MENVSAILLLALRVLMALALYAFLGWSFYLIWRDLRQQAENLNQQRVPPLLISLLDEVEQVEQLRFTAPEVVIGRHPNCEWVLANETVSTQHARLLFHHDQWWIEDLHSKNGTFVNEQALDGPVVLANDDRIRCGQVNFEIQFEELK
jgi:pSer/pThr/pTyr-binding forkhead associated (FHA) protein